MYVPYFRVNLLQQSQWLPSPVIISTREGSLLILLWISVAHQRFIKLSLQHSDLPSLLFGLLSGFSITTFRASIVIHPVSSNSLWISTSTLGIDFHTGRIILWISAAQNTTQPQNQNQPSQPLVPKANRCFFTEEAGLGSSADDYISELVVGCTHGTIHCRYLSA